MRLLRRADSVTALCAAAYTFGAQVPIDEAAPRALGWLRRLWAEGADHLPFVFVHDLGFLLLHGARFRLRSTQDLGAWPEEERAGRLAYEDQALGRWLLDERVLQASAAINGLAAELRDAAIAYALRLALEAPLRGADLLIGNAAFLRELEAEIVEGLRAAAPPDEAWRRFAFEIRDTAIEALPRGPLFSLADLWELERFAALPLESTRLALRALQAVRDALPPVHVAIAGRLKRLAQEIPVEDKDSDHFPAGGFDALSSQGRMENLVRSEVAYVDTEIGGGLDLFDLRYVLGELLYYTRDDSPLLEARRVFTFVIDQPARLRHKHKGLPAQTLTLVEGVLLRLERDLSDIFGARAVETRWLWRAQTSEDEAAAAEEEALLRQLLASALAHRRVRLSRLDPETAWPSGRCLIFSPMPPPPKKDRPEGVWMRVGDLAWILEEMSYTPLRRETLDTLLLRGLLVR